MEFVLVPCHRGMCCVGKHQSTACDGKAQSECWTSGPVKKKVVPMGLAGEGVQELWQVSWGESLS